MIQVDQFVADNHVEWTLAPVAAPTNAAAPADLATVKQELHPDGGEVAAISQELHIKKELHLGGGTTKVIISALPNPLHTPRSQLGTVLPSTYRNSSRILAP